MKRVIAWILTCAMLVSLVPQAALTAAAASYEEITSQQQVTESPEAQIPASSDSEPKQKEPVAAKPEALDSKEPTLSVNAEAAGEQSAVVQSETASGFAYTVLNGTYCQITGYTGTETEVQIPAEVDGYIVQSIASDVFRNNTTLTSVVFPDTIETIGTYLFSGCTALTDVSFNHGLTSVSRDTFSGCTSLESITLPATVTSIGDYAFNGCTALSSINLPCGIASIGSWAFLNCTALSDLGLGEGLTGIGRSAFEGCAALTEVILPDSVVTIGYAAFNNCAKLSSINYPLSWAEAGSYRSGYGGAGYQGQIFAGCSSLKKIEIPEGVTAIPSCAFVGSNYLEEVVLPESLTTIGSEAFYDCIGLKTVELVEGLTAIPNGCFFNCTGLSEVVIPSTVTSIGSSAYYNCIGLRTITLGEGLKSIGSNAFYGCDGVLSLVLNDGLETISGDAFRNCENLKAVEIPNSVTSIGGNAFDGCSKLTIYCYSGTQAHMVGESEGYTIYLLDEHDHEYTAQVETAPTCTRGGSQILTCSICGYYFVDIMEPLGHDYTSTVVAPTCEEDGYTLFECGRCDDSYQGDVVAATGHEYGEWEIVTEAVCDTDGSQKRVCGVCGNEETQVIAAPGHSYEEVVIPPTCSAKGCTVHTCSVCGDAYGDSYVDQLEHSFGEWTVTKAATILQTGVRERTCANCPETETEELAKLNVDLENNEQYGLANFTVLDAVTLQPVSGASIFVTTDNDGEVTLITDENGKVSQILPVGRWSASVYADGYMVRNLKIKVEAGEQDIPTIGISDKPLVDATITTTEMTLEEIRAAGIDVTDEGNKHYYKYEVEIRFHEELDIMSIISYGDGEGNILKVEPPTGGEYSRNETHFALSHEGSTVSAEPVTIVHSSEYGTYISDRSHYTNAVWTPTVSDTIDFVNNGYHFEGYGIPSELTMTTSRAFPDTGWVYHGSPGKLSMTVGERTHYLTYQSGRFCTVSSRGDAVGILLFERISADGYPTEADYVYIPAETIVTGKQYLLVQENEIGEHTREAMSHLADIPTHDTVTIHDDDVYGEFIEDEAAYGNAKWLSAAAGSGGLKIVNNHYYAQVSNSALTFNPLANGTGWTLDGSYLTTDIGGETFYLRYSGGTYHVTKDEAYAGSVMLFEKTSVTDIVSGSGATVTKDIYRRVHSFEEGKEYIIVGSGRNPSRGGASYGPSGGGGGGKGGGIGGVLPGGMPFTVYPVSEQFYLIIYGEVGWLKEMYDVEMLILNNSSTDTIENCVAELLLPEGLSLAAMEEGEQSAVQTVDHIPENGSHSLHWYVRGDQEGVYNVTATLSGTMMPFEEDFFYEYEAVSPIKVYAGSAMHMTFHIPDTAYKGVDYVVRIELENVSNKVLYNVRHAITGWEQGKITYWSDGRVVPEEYGSGGFVGDYSVTEFYPGDKIVLEVGFEILFESSIIKNLMDTVDQAEELYEYYEAVKTAYDMFEAVTNFCDSAGSALDGIVSAGKITDSEKLKATNSLLSALNKLFSKIEKGDSEALAIANKIQSSDFYKSIKSCADAAGCEAFVQAETAKGILELTDKILCVIDGEEEKEEDGPKPFNAFDSMRTMISNLPVRFVVDSVTVSTRDKSTTTIPYTIKMVPATAPYMGVDNWGRYIYNMVIASMGKIESPWYAQIFGAPDDVTGYEDAVAYIQQQEDQMAAYSVHKSSVTTFRAWLEPAAAARSSVARTSDSGFLLETDNETAVYENGVLTFTGNAILEVTALTAQDGILYIEDDEGNIKTIHIDVVEAHTCHSDTWNVELAPTQDHDGYRAKLCDICGDTIAVEVLSLCDEHIFGEWIIEQAATAEEMGVWYHECENCGAMEIEYHEAGVARNTATETNYATVKEALANAQAGQTVKLLMDCTEATVMVIPGVTLDLNGFELTASYAVGFDTGHIIDGAGTGRLITERKHMVLDEENAMIPVYDGEGYVFAKAGFAIRQDMNYQGAGIKIDAVAYPVRMNVVELLKDGCADNNIQMVIRLDWDTEEGKGSQEFVFSNQVVSDVYSSNDGTWTGYSKMFSMVITGFENIRNLNACMAVVSGTNAVYVSPNSVDIT